MAGIGKVLELVCYCAIDLSQSICTKLLEMTLFSFVLGKSIRFSHGLNHGTVVSQIRSYGAISVASPSSSRAPRQMLMALYTCAYECEKCFYNRGMFCPPTGGAENCG